MAPYFDHMHRKPAHDRRLHAMRVAGVLTALVFVGWVTTLGVSSGTDPQSVAGTDSAAQAAAAIGAGFGGAVPAQAGNQLVVATSSN